MKNRKTLFTILLLCIALFAAFLVAGQMFSKDTTITLPESVTEGENGENTPSADGLNIISITPATVQAAISTLSRPTSYQRTQTVEIFWRGGSSATAAQVAVSGSVMRIDTTLPDGSICHTLLSGDSSAVWYDDDQTWITLRADQYSADALLRIPTYETVLELTTEAIVHAEYCLKDSVYCIYVQTAPDENGYAERYWISVKSGLLFAAERTCDEELIYRFSATEPVSEAPTESLFLLPNGSKFQP